MSSTPIADHALLSDRHGLACPTATARWWCWCPATSCREVDDTTRGMVRQTRRDRVKVRRGPADAAVARRAAGYRPVTCRAAPAGVAERRQVAILLMLRRSQAAREQAHRDVDASVEAIATLVALVTALADRMQKMPSAGLERDRERRARTQLLRSTAAAGRRTLAARARPRAQGQDGQHHARG